MKPSKYITRGPIHGQCNICGVTEKLTEDHIPPKGSTRITQVEMLHLVEVLGATKPTAKGRISQNGVKFRTICAHCNNERLGLHYDPSLNEFTGQLASILTSPLKLPPVVAVKIKPQRVLRAVIGHLLAFQVERPASGPFDTACARYFLDERAPMPDGLNAYYWLYPYNNQLLVRDAAFTDLRVGEPAVFKLMKFFPVSFFLTWEAPAQLSFPFGNLTHFRHAGLDQEVTVGVSLRNIPHMHWPEAPTDETFILYGAGAMAARQHTPR